MVADIDTEARRKAMRKGEEDPFVVAQRYLNIYRQMHIFSPERKEAFDKMLLELSPNIRGMFSSLPGGSMLQDYVDDLAEKAGVEKSIPSISSVSLNDDANQQAQILANALAKAQTQTPQINVPANNTPAKLSMDKDFAGEFAKIIGGLMQQQSVIQKEGLEKVSSDLNKTQLLLAKLLKEDKDEQQEKLKNLYEIISQSQTALGTTLSKLLQSTSSAEAEGNSTQELIQIVLDGQKQINLRLDKVEELSTNKANDNIQLIQVFEKSQNEIIKSLSNLQANTIVPRSDIDDERLAKIISQSQENIIKTIMTANLQQNNTSANQANNNANNIQINTVDNSSQMMLLIDKIASLQATNEQNLEKVITKTIEAQSEIYSKVHSQQNKEIAEAIAEAIKSIHPVPQPVYVMPQQTNTVIKEAVVSENDDNSETSEYLTGTSETDDASAYFENYAVQDAENTASEADITQEIESEIDEIKDLVDNNEKTTGEDVLEFVSDVTPAPKKKRKKKKKNKNKVAQVDVEISQQDSFIPKSEDDFSVDDLPSVSESVDDISLFESKSADENTKQEYNIVEEKINDEPITILSDSETANDVFSNGWSDFSAEETIASETEDWGFDNSKKLTTDNDNQEDQDWEWVYVEEDENGDYSEVEAIGENSYIYSADLYSQEQASGDAPIIYGGCPIEIKKEPQIYNDNDYDEMSDPYQNSILKD